MSLRENNFRMHFPGSVRDTLPCNAASLWFLIVWTLLIFLKLILKIVNFQFHYVSAWYNIPNLKIIYLSSKYFSQQERQEVIGIFSKLSSRIAGHFVSERVEDGVGTTAAPTREIPVEDCATSNASTTKLQRNVLLDPWSNFSSSIIPERYSPRSTATQ